MEGRAGCKVARGERRERGVRQWGKVWEPHREGIENGAERTSVIHATIPSSPGGNPAFLQTGDPDIVLPFVAPCKEQRQ